jgi:hypothetical protein
MGTAFAVKAALKARKRHHSGSCRRCTSRTSSHFRIANERSDKEPRDQSCHFGAAGGGETWARRNHDNGLSLSRSFLLYLLLTFFAGILFRAQMNGTGRAKLSLRAEFLRSGRQNRAAAALINSLPPQPVLRLHPPTHPSAGRTSAKFLSALALFVPAHVALLVIIISWGFLI